MNSPNKGDLFLFFHTDVVTVFSQNMTIMFKFILGSEVITLRIFLTELSSSCLHFLILVIKHF